MPNTVRPDALDWLELLQSRVLHLEEYRRRVEPQLASEFNVLRYARSDELGLSQILADLFDPRGPHGQGGRFLACFLRRYWPECAAPGSDVRVRTEVPTDRIAARKRRVDIEIDLGGCVLAIENKPWASDQPAQLTDYLAHLKSTGRPYKLLYLAGYEGRLPSAQSIAGGEFEAQLDAKALAVTYYAELQEWLRDCLRCCENERVAMFLRDLDRFIAKQFSGFQQGFESELIADAATSSVLGVSAAVQLARCASDVRQLLLQKLETQLHEQFARVSAEAGLNGWRLFISKPLTSQYATIELALHASSALKLAVAFERPNCGDCFFGVGRRCAEDRADIAELHQKLDAAFGFGERGDWWGWSRAFEQRYWWNDRSTWDDIASGAMAKKIVERLCGMAEIADAKFRPAFEQATKGVIAPVPRGEAPRTDSLALEIVERSSPPLIGLLFAVEAGNLALRRTLAERVAAGVRDVLCEQVGQGTWMLTDKDLTRIYAGFGFHVDKQDGLELHVSFESWGCRNAIYGIVQPGVDGRSETASELRRRLVAQGLAPGRESPGWIWYRSLTPSSWFDSVDTAVACYDGRAAREIARQLADLLQIVRKAQV